MCGIAGVLYFNGTTPSLSTLQNMTDIIYHRGPDDSGIWIENNIGLGFRRLSIIDLQEGHQPLSNEDDTLWIIFNGEIYNYKQLRAQLEEKGHRFKTHSDTEVILHSYEEYGQACLQHLRGMFSFAIWDKKEQQLFAARDPFGIKPFYYFCDHEKLVFASEIKSILTVEGINRAVDRSSLLNYLTFQYVPDPSTMFQNIFKLPPAHCFTMDSSGRMNLHKYWDPTFEPLDRPLDYFVDEIRQRMKDSVSHHLQSDVQRGCFLSSGIDSTAIAAYMSSMESIKTFSVGFEGVNDETIIARDTAARLGTEHYSRLISMEDYFTSIPKTVWHQDEPVADPAAIALYHVAQLAREHVKVVLSGEGADEIFGGYRIYQEPHSLRPISWLPASLKRLLNQLIRALPLGFTGKNYLLRGTTPLEERFLGNAKIFTEDMKSELLQFTSNSIDNYTDPVSLARLFYDKTTHLDPVSRMQYIDLNLWMPGDILMKADKLTMAHSLELRVPFLDKEVFEIARRIPASYRIAHNTTKYAFRRAMEGIVPETVIQRPKLGFPVPLKQWLQGNQARVMLEQIQSSGIDHLFNMNRVEELFMKHIQKKGDYSRRMWVIYIFAMWHTCYIQEFPRSSHH